jgi:hypothetical protein
MKRAFQVGLIGFMIGWMLCSAAFLARFLLVRASWSRTPHLCQASGRAFEETWVLYASCDDKLLVAAWCDISNKNIAGTGGDQVRMPGGVDRLVHSTSVRSKDGRSAAINIMTEDGKADGLVTVNGCAYQLKDGTLFLVRTHADTASVIQVNLDLAGMKPDDLTWQRLAEENPEVKEFLVEAGNHQ